MKIGVLSDTHLREPNPEFKQIVEFHFKEVEKIFHAGDFVEWSVIEYLSNFKELIGVCGNMDPPKIRENLPLQQIVEISGFKIGLTHGSGAPFGIESRIKEGFNGINAIIYGHTHVPANHKVGKIYFFNPGSPTRSFIDRGTLGILHIGERIEGEIIKL